MATIRGSARTLITLGSALLILTGCDKLTGNVSGGGATEFARAALERNENLTIVAYDENEKSFTVRSKDTGELSVVRIDQIIGTVPGAPTPSAPRPVSDQAPPPGEITANAPPPAGASTTSTDIARSADQVDTRYPDESQSAANGNGVITDPRTGKVLASSGSGEGEIASVTRGGRDETGRKVLASGPGYSIKAGEPSNASVRLASRASQIPSPARGAAVERRYEPMICQGAQLMHIDGRNLEFEGDALTVEGGCEIHITNSHIIAHGVGISARAANVHIKNSVIEGDGGSISASNGAKVYTQQSTFKGLSRRLDTATFTDLGGTTWN